MNIRPSAAIAAIAAVLILTGCGSTESTTGTESTGSAGTQAASGSPASGAPASPSCRSQALAWENGGGASHVEAVVSGLSAIEKAFVAAQDPGSDPSRAESALQSAAASLQSDVHVAEAALPPACIPGLRLTYGQALTDYSRVADDFQDTAAELRRGNRSAAMADAQAGTNEMGAGGAKFDAANAALRIFIGSQS